MSGRGTLLDISYFANPAERRQKGRDCEREIESKKKGYEYSTRRVVLQGTNVVPGSFVLWTSVPRVIRTLKRNTVGEA